MKYLVYLNFLVIAGAAVVSFFKMLKIAYQNFKEETSVLSKEIIQETPGYKGDFFTLMLFMITVIISIAWRISSMPFVSGGFFDQCWLSMVGLVFFRMGTAQLNRLMRFIFRFTLIPLACAILYGSLYFNREVLLPVSLICVVLFLSFSKWLKGKKPLALLISMFIIPLSAWFNSGFKQTIPFFQLKSLEARQVERIEFGSFPQVLKLPEDIHRFVTALNDTNPYDPDQERIREPSYITRLKLKSGAELQFRMGRGNDYYAETTWIQWGEGRYVYQNASLYQAMMKLQLPLWDKEVEPSKGGAERTMIFFFLFIIVIMTLVLIIERMIPKKGPQLDF